MRTYATPLGVAVQSSLPKQVNEDSLTAVQAVIDRLYAIFYSLAPPQRKVVFY